MSVIFENDLSTLGQTWFKQGTILVGNTDYANYKTNGDDVYNTAQIQAALDEAFTKQSLAFSDGVEVRIITNCTVVENVTFRQTWTGGSADGTRKLAVALRSGVRLIITAGCTITCNSNNGTSIFGNVGNLSGAEVICEGIDAFYGSANSIGSFNTWQSAIWLDARSTGCDTLQDINIVASGTRFAGPLVRTYNSDITNVQISQNINVKVTDSKLNAFTVFHERQGENINSHVVNAVSNYQDSVVYKDGITNSKLIVDRIVSSARHGVRLYINPNKTGSDALKFNNLDVEINSIKVSGEQGIEIGGFEGVIKARSTQNNRAGINFSLVTAASVNYYPTKIILDNCNFLNNNQSAGGHAGIQGIIRNLEIIGFNASDTQVGKTQFRGINFENSLNDNIVLVSGTATGNTDASQIVVRGVNSSVNPETVVGWDRLVTVTPGATFTINGPEDSYILGNASILKLPQYSKFNITNLVEYNIAAAGATAQVQAEQEADLSYKSIDTLAPGVPFPMTQNQAFQFVRNLDQWRLANNPREVLAQENFTLHAMARQAVINGNFDVWERGATFATPANASYTADRWKMSWAVTGSAPVITVARVTTTAAKSRYAYRVSWDGAGSGFGANDSYAQLQHIEGGTKLLCGAGKKVTVSFTSSSNIANKKIGVYLIQDYGTGGSPTSPETLIGTNFTLTSTPTTYTYTFTTNTLSGKTFGTNQNDSLRLVFVEMWGTGTTATNIGSVGVAETFRGAGYVEFTAVQLCSGDVALPYQPKTYGQELFDCQRYFQSMYNPNSIYSRFGTGLMIKSNIGDAMVPLARSLRATPVVTFNLVDVFISDGVFAPVTSITVTNTTVGYVSCEFTTSGSFPLPSPAILIASGSINAFIAFNSDF